MPVQVLGGTDGCISNLRLVDLAKQLEWFEQAVGMRLPAHDGEGVGIDGDIFELIGNITEHLVAKRTLHSMGVFAMHVRLLCRSEGAS